MNKIQDTLTINVKFSAEDQEYGPVYVATNDSIGLVTDGKTLDDLLLNLRDALAACFDDTDTIAEFNLKPNPKVVLVIEMPESYAKVA